VKTKDLLSVADLSAAEAEKIIAQALKLKRGPAPQLLSDKILALMFEKPSLRTRASFEVAVRQLGAQPLCAWYCSPYLLSSNFADAGT